MERELLVERTRAGLAAVKKLGRVGGRKRLMTNSKIQSAKTLLDNGRATSGSGAESGSFYPNALPLVACIRTLFDARFFPFHELSLYPPLLWLLYWVLPL